MFTGIVEEIGTVHSVEHRPGGPADADGHDLRLVIGTRKIADPPLGSSIAVDGVCLTVVSAARYADDESGAGASAVGASTTGQRTTSASTAGAPAWLLAFDVMPQTLKLTTLGKLQVGSEVNLERAALVTSRLDGHVVQGHVDGTATLVSRQPGPRWDWLRFTLPEHLLPYLAMQGSITVAGVSLTVASLDQSGFCVALIPTTLADTTLGELQVGQQVNVEVDALAKYADRLRQAPMGSGNAAASAPASAAFGAELSEPASAAGGWAAAQSPWASQAFVPPTGSTAPAAPRLSINKIAEAELPTEWGNFQIAIFRDETGTDHVALVASPPVAEGDDDGEPSKGSESVAASEAGEAPLPPLVRVHSECLTGDAFGSLRCDCGPQLHTSMSQVAQQGGAVIYMRGHEGRGIGLAAKIAAYTLQDQGRDTVQANEDLGYPVDARDYAAAATILRALGMPTVRLLTNNPAKQAGLEAAGVKVAELVPLEVGHGPENLSYLETKRARLGHILTGLGSASGATSGLAAKALGSEDGSDR